MTRCDTISLGGRLQNQPKTEAALGTPRPLHRSNRSPRGFVFLTKVEPITACSSCSFTCNVPCSIVELPSSVAPVLPQTMETVLVVGASGNIGVSVIIAALRSGRQVLAIVRNKAAEDRLFQHVGTKEGITTVEADVATEDGVQTVVEQVKGGKLPAFQHVYSAGTCLFSFDCPYLG